MQDPNQPYYGGHCPPQPNYPPQQPGYPPQQPGNMSDGYRPQLGFVLPPPVRSGFEFDDLSIRRGFIRKVYFILAVQQQFISLAISFVLWHQPTKQWLLHHSEIFYFAVLFMVMPLISMARWSNVLRKAPMNFICLTLFTLAWAFLFAVCTGVFNSKVMLAVGVEMAVWFGLVLFTFQTKWNFTAMGGILYATVLSLILFGLVAIFFSGLTIAVVWAATIGLIRTICVMYDTQQMLDGRHIFSINPEEYIFAVLNLNIFHTIRFRNLPSVRSRP